VTATLTIPARAEAQLGLGMDRDPAAGGMVDHRAVDWPRVRWAGYLLHQRFHYEYPGPIHDLRQRLVVIPPERHGNQRLVTHRLEVSSPTTEVRRDQDQWGNLVLSLALDHVAHAIDFTIWIVVERDTSAGPIIVTPQAHLDPSLLTPTHLTEADDALRSAAAMFSGQTDPDDDAEGLALAAQVNAWVHTEMSYADGATGVRTTAAEAFAGRRGVCQDYAHIMLTLCRLLGLPCRYVSGHLLGEGGTHAWVEVVLPEPGPRDRRGRPHRYVAHPFDPTHGSQPGLNYLTVAVGRDYGDVAPVSGTYRASFGGTLTTRKHAGVTAVEYGPG